MFADVNAALIIIINPFCVSVCLFVSDYSRTTGYEAAYERYQQIQCYKGRKNNVAIKFHIRLNFTSTNIKVKSMLKANDIKKQIKIIL